MWKRSCIDTIGIGRWVSNCVFVFRGRSRNRDAWEFPDLIIELRTGLCFRAACDDLGATARDRGYQEDNEGFHGHITRTPTSIPLLVAVISIVAPDGESGCWWVAKVQAGVRAGSAAAISIGVGTGRVSTALCLMGGRSTGTVVGEIEGLAELRWSTS